MTDDPGIRIVVTSSVVMPPPPWKPSGTWPLLEEDGTTATHLKNIGADYERQRRKAITAVALARHEQDIAESRGWTYGLAVHRAVAAAREEREFHRCVWLSDQDRGMVFHVLYGSPAPFAEIVRRLNGEMGRRQTRRALMSLEGRGAVVVQRRELSSGKTARFFTAVIPTGMA